LLSRYGRSGNFNSATSAAHELPQFQENRLARALELPQWSIHDGGIRLLQLRDTVHTGAVPFASLILESALPTHSARRVPQALRLVPASARLAFCASVEFRGSAICCPLLRAAAASACGVTDKVALHVSETAEDGDHQAPGAGAGVSPRFGSERIAPWRPTSA